MDGQGPDRYFNHLLNSSSPLSDNSMEPDQNGQFNGYFLSGNNQRPQTNGYLSSTDHRPFDDSSYFSIANHRNFGPYSNDSIESEFNRLGISSPNYPFENRSAPRNVGLSSLYMDPLSFYDTGLNGLSDFYMYQRNNALMNGTNYGRTYSNSNSYSNYVSNLNLNLNRPRPYNYRSEYEIGPWNSYPSFNTRPIVSTTANGLGSQPPSSSSTLRRQISPSSFSSLNELRGKIALAAKDQMGCRFLQSKFEEGDIQDINLMYSELKDNIWELMVHQFGNYLLQKLFKVCDGEQRTHLLCLLISDERKFKEICNNIHGTRAVQRLIEYLTTPEQRSLFISGLRRITLAVIRNNNGQHVIQNCFKHFPVEDNKHILNVVADNVVHVATDKSGCCVLQQCLTESVGESRDHLIAEITVNARFLSEDPYGNYVVQYILGLRMDHVTSAVMKQLSGNFVMLSMNKYGSNVVEKILKQSEGDEALAVIEELIDSKHFLRVLQDPYGNYVAQSALSVSRGPVHHALCGLINANYPFLHSHPHGKRVLARAKGLRLRP